MTVHNIVAGSIGLIAINTMALVVVPVCITAAVYHGLTKGDWCKKELNDCKNVICKGNKEMIDAIKNG